MRRHTPETADEKDMAERLLFLTYSLHMSLLRCLTDWRYWFSAAVVQEVGILKAV
jgi:hypothetical protein